MLDSDPNMKAAITMNTVAAMVHGVFTYEKEEKESAMEGWKPPPMTNETPLLHKQRSS